MTQYRVEFAVDIDGDTPRDACINAWFNLIAPDSQLPIGTVISRNGQSVDIDLDGDPEEDEEDEEENPHADYDYE